jgi:hypothetical protein
VLGVGCGVWVDVGCWVLGVGCWVLGVDFGCACLRLRRWMQWQWRCFLAAPSAQPALGCLVSGIIASPRFCALVPCVPCLHLFLVAGHAALGRAHSGGPAGGPVPVGGGKAGQVSQAMDFPVCHLGRRAAGTCVSLCTCVCTRVRLCVLFFAWLGVGASGGRWWGLGLRHGAPDPPHPPSPLPPPTSPSLPQVATLFEHLKAVCAGHLHGAYLFVAHHVVGVFGSMPVAGPVVLPGCLQLCEATLAGFGADAARMNEHPDVVSGVFDLVCFCCPALPRDAIPRACALCVRGVFVVVCTAPVAGNVQWHLGVECVGLMATVLFACLFCLFCSFVCSIAGVCHHHLHDCCRFVV